MFWARYSSEYYFNWAYMSVPVITIDGPSASGKGTVAALVASRLVFHYLDSGSLYRLVALLAYRRQVAFDDEQVLAEIARHLPVVFQGEKAFLHDEDVSVAIRAEAVGVGASRISVLPAVRAALLSRQREFRRFPGLVTDGRDMGSVVFPDATVKVFLTARDDIRAQRRYKQLIGKGEPASIERIMRDLLERDRRDATRSLAPLRQEPGALLLDTSAMAIDQVVDQIIAWFDGKATLVS